MPTRLIERERIYKRFGVLIPSRSQLLKSLLIGGKQMPGPVLANITLVIVEKASFSEKKLVTCNFVCNSKNMLLGLSNGQIQLVSWNVSQYCALRLLQAALDESLYELAGELLWFVLRSVREYENSTTESNKLSPKHLGYFLFRSTSGRQSSDLRSNLFEDLSPHIAYVKNILESHTTHLISGKELSKLVAFVKGTQFDLVEYLQRERQSIACLENFASRLELIGQKLQMDTLQSRLDAEVLLAHMCSVKFKEWIVVLATLLRRTEVLVDLFRHDIRLWNAYKQTIQSHAPFHGYLDLLDASAEQLALVSDLQLLKMGLLRCLIPHPID